MASLRRAGRARLAGGRLLLWSVAEGGRGRRWRASTRTASGGLLDDLLLEVEPGGRVTRLEVSTPAGQLTFHPESHEDTAHGNVVTAHGVHHIAMTWAPGTRIEIPWSPIADAVLVGGLAAGSAVLAVATIGPDLVPQRRTLILDAMGERRWRVEGRLVALSADGLPLLAEIADEVVDWPLEDPGLLPS